jgi:hypothetical protein
VPKVRGSTLAADYRPISITSSIGKLAEHFLLEQITSAIDANLPIWILAWQEHDGRSHQHRAQDHASNGQVQRRD